MCEVSSHRHSAYLTDIRRNASAGFGLRVEKVPVVYHRSARVIYLSLDIKHGRYMVSYWGSIYILVSIQVFEVIVYIYTCLIRDVDLLEGVPHFLHRFAIFDMGEL
jgi:hypothetical protein